MKKKLSESQCIQYADDSTIYKNLQNSVMLVHQNENIKPAYLEEASKIFNDISMKYDKIFVRCHFQCSNISS